jgi:hypothetical protein
MNKFLVGCQGDRYHVMKSPTNMSADDALNLAAWLVAMAGPFAARPFDQVLAEVKKS